MKKYLVALIILLIPIVTLANLEPLPVNQAFKFSVTKTNTDSIVAHWQIAPNYYLYKERFSFKILKPKNMSYGEIFYPTGIMKDDKILGKHEVYENSIDLSIPILNPDKRKFEILVGYQGCSSEGFCYPPMLKLVKVNPKAMFGSGISINEYTTKAPTIDAKTITQNQAITTAPVSQLEQSTNILSTGNKFVALLAFFGFGLLLAFTPCVLPMIPILSGIIAGKTDIHTRKAFTLSLVYVLSMSITFAIAGVIVGLVGENLQAAMQAPWVLITFSIIFVLLALSLFGFYEIRLPAKLQQRITNISNHQRAGHYFGVAVMGCLATLIVSPCVSAPLVGALAYIAKTGNAFFGGAALFAMGIGMGIPLLIIGTSIGKWLPKAGAWMNTVKYIFGVLMLAVAIWLISRILPGPVTLFLWACLAIGSAIFLGALKRTSESGWQKLWQSAGFILLVYGSMMLIGSTMGSSDPFSPLMFTAKKEKVQSQQILNVKRVTTMAELNKELSLARAQNKPVMLDFYADWCIACKEMEANTFSDPEVQAALKNTIVIKADVTANNQQTKAIEKRFGVIAPPTFIFFNTKGDVIPKSKIVGEMGPQDFIKALPWNRQ